MPNFAILRLPQWRGVVGQTLKGLKGVADFDKDGIITVDEAYNYVSINVPLATGQAQHPVKKGSVEGQLIIGIVE